MKNFVRHFDFMHQTDDYSCGRVCAYMVTANFGVRGNRKWLRYLLKTDFNLGTFQKDLVKALRKFKFVCSPHASKSFYNVAVLSDLLEKYLDAGYLAIACVDNNDHWIVVRAIRNNRVYIADPDWTAPKHHHLVKFFERVKDGSIVFVKRKL